MDDLSDFRFLGYQIVNIAYHINDVQNPTERTNLPIKFLFLLVPKT